VWGIGLVGAAAAVTAVAVTMSVTPPRATDPLGTRKPVPTATTVRLSARDVLLAAAEQATRQPDESGAYWHTVYVSRTLFAADGYQVMSQERTEGWTPRATGKEQWGRSEPLGARPATDADEEAWKAAGSPSEIPVTVPGKPRPLSLSTSPGKAHLSHSPLVDGDKVFWLGRNVTMKDLRGLPSDAGKLKAWLLRSYEGHDTESDSLPMSSDAWLFTVSVGLITDMPVTPKVRGAAFRMLAGLDTVDLLENATDAEGRQGTAVSIEEKMKGGGVLAHRLIFDRATGQGLANESVVVKRGGPQAGFEPGSVRSSVAVLEAGWTDTEPS
jgi:hypothetical protein